MSLTIAVKPVNLPSTSFVFSTLLKADLTAQWRNRRASMLQILMPVIILVSWKGLIEHFGGAFALSNCITVGLNAIGLMGYSNSIARDRDKGIFQRLRVAPGPNWTIMASRLTVQLLMIVIMTTAVFLVGYEYEHISVSATGYVTGYLVAIIGGAVYLGLGQAIVGRIQNPETVNATSRLIYIVFIMIGMFAEFGTLGKEIGNAVKWSPYGTVKRIVAAGIEPATWNHDTSIALLVTIGYTIVFTFLGIKWFRWNTR